MTNWQQIHTTDRQVKANHPLPIACNERIIASNQRVSGEQLFWIGLSGLDLLPPCNPLAFAVPASPPQRRYDREDELAENRIIVQCGE
ncbi:hypothetical protein [Chloroflexus sp.]|uniref:hypothetical protein n=1 Tax=Chloroflexus sp. TaxID=1904827 RepID=UPI002ADE9323|nr:hypothetical protein [Chloroflexus sp.]